MGRPVCVRAVVATASSRSAEIVPRGRRAARAALEGGVALGLAALAATVALGDVPAAPSARAMALAAAAVVVTVALDPVRPGAAAAAARAALAAILGGVLARLGAGAFAGRTATVALAAGTLALGLAAGARLAVLPLASAARARLLVLATFAVAGAAPLWLGPLAEVGGGPAVSAVVAASPASYLAVATGHDYLREPELYARSPLGSLRFEYPGLVPATAAWLAAACGCLAAERLLQERRRRS